MAPNRRPTTRQKKAEEEIREANFTAAIQAIREKKTKNLRTAAAEFKVSYHTLCRRAQNLTKPHSKAHKNLQLLTEGQEVTICVNELCDIAAALRLPETGLKAELLQRIMQFFDGQPELKKNQRYEGLFNPSCSRRRCYDLDGICWRRSNRACVVNGRGRPWASPS
ncbi:uncharacterized protein EDB93DRAFT_1252917 [Suillus bovinus]|uniref:uncharacterized protein n=1 Tax=Suillus bovinus TaxID=48563 RepID=UPI001B87255C|nr:uncharacterized protein EDB93DRAFT_1252917 [Suillus bovinus]KAG2139790.1 hypothetical protein EDB93DRAFT_1252917 [Suillus bovinus]